MGMIEIERHSLVTIKASACKIYLETADRNSGKPERLPTETRRVMTLDGWLCEASRSRLYIREARRTAYKESLRIEFLPCADIEVESLSDSGTSTYIGSATSLYFIEKPNHISMEYSTSADEKTSDAKDDPMRDATDTVLIENELPFEDKLKVLKKRLEMDVSSVKSMEQGKQVKKGIILEHLSYAERELNSAKAAEHLEKAEREIKKAEKLMANVVKKQEDAQYIMERATQTTGKIQ